MQNISKLYQDAEGVVILAGAGMGVDSGPVSYTHLTLPTNREV